ncbi:unnamed protein product [Leptosia nina]|uniref:Lipase n=1 Tax=Leptosia nina TaxID=320188 RepID=A0AAV1JZ33_9NEOP
MHFLILIICCVRAVLTQSCTPQDATLNFEELATKYGYPPQKYKVTTEDGYILTLYRLPGPREPVLLQHGTLDSSSTWLLRGNNSLGITLANANYDVWISNLRGNKYSRDHTLLDPDKDDAYWNIDLDHFGTYDLPAIIDTILHVTRLKKIKVIAHSAGNTIFYILGSMRPNYNKKIKLLIALAPIAYMHNSYNAVTWLGSNVRALDDILLNFNVHELFGETTLLQKLLKVVCNNPLIGYEVCLNRLLFPLTGFDNEQIKPDFNPIIFGHFPAGFPRKSLLHFSHIWRRKEFIRFDYGSQNYRFYNSTEPPRYNLGAVTMRIVLIAGRNDWLAPLKNVNLLSKKLPNVVQYIIHPLKQFNHLDFTWGENVKENLFPYIFDALNMYS